MPAVPGVVIAVWMISPSAAIVVESHESRQTHDEVATVQEDIVKGSLPVAGLIPLQTK